MSNPTAREIFKKLDEEFIGISNINDEVFTFQSSDVDVLNVTTLKFPISLPNTVITYSFTTRGGICQFSVLFKNSKNKDICLLPAVWADSDVRAINGEFTLKESGVIFFSWDNSRQSWISKKRLTYSIQIRQGAFSFDDNARCKSHAYTIEYTYCIYHT